MHWDNQFWKGISTDIIKHSPLMKILCVVTIEALIDGRGMGEVGVGREVEAVQDMMVEVLPTPTSTSLSCSPISIRRVLFSSQ